MDLRGPPARRGFDRVCGWRGADLLRRLPARMHVLGLAVPGRGRPRAADRARQAAVRPGRRTWRWCGGSGLLLRLARRLAVVSIAIALALIPHVASAHAQLVQSDPAPDSVLDSAPTSITLIFSEPVTPAGAGIRVFDPSGRQVAGAVSTRGSVLTAPIISSWTGTYVVSWQVLAADTHPSRGAFRVVVRRPSSNPYASLLDVPEAGTATPVGLALQAIARWVHFAGFALVFGFVAYKARMRQGLPPEPLVGAAVLLVVAAEPPALPAPRPGLGFDGDTALAVLASSFGRIAGLR